MSPKHARRRRRWPFAVVTAVVVIVVAIALVVVPSGGHVRPAVAARPHPTTTVQRPATATAALGSGPDGVTASWVQAENAKPGTTAWVIGPQAGPPISGFADHTSAQEGQTVGLYVSTTAPSFTVTAYRMGWYGGALARQVWTSPTVPATAQPPCPVTPGTYMVSCPWTRSLTATVDRAWPPGDYLFKLVATGGQASYVPLTVIDTSSHSTYVVLNSVLTWQAWNDYGGHSCFAGAGGQQGPTTADRARVVSYDRPYAGQGDGEWIGLEQHTVAFAERAGLDVSYLTDIDVNEDPGLLANHKAVFSLGHNEFWGAGERQGAVDALAAGVNVAFLGATPALRPARLQPSPLGPDREEVAYRDAKADPIYATQPQLATANEWSNPPLDKPASRIVGQSYGGYGISAPMVITDPGAWVFTGTGATAGTQLPGVIGGDYDHPASGAPPGVRTFTASPVTTSYGHHDVATMSYYTAPSGAGVIDVGSIAFTAYLAGSCGISCTDVQTMVGNIFRVFGAGPAAHDPATAAA